MGVSGHFGLKNETRKTVKIPKDVELYLYELSLYAYFSVSKCPNISIYILFTNRIETLRLRDTSSIRDIRKF